MCDFDHPSVFDPHFYLNNWPDLEHHGLHTKEAAAQHWCDHGVDEGRQATASFHTKQYLGIYCKCNGYVFSIHVVINILLANYLTFKKCLKMITEQLCSTTCTLD